MKVEAFSEGKNLDAPEANEDQFLVLPGSGYAVLDGATDNTGRLYDGKRGGWHASRIAMRTVGEFVRLMGRMLTEGMMPTLVAKHFHSTATRFVRPLL